MPVKRVGRAPITATRRRGSGSWYADGLGFGVDDSWHNPVEVIPWSELEAIAREMPDEVREELVEFTDRLRQHQSAYPGSLPERGRGRCGPIAAGEPLTER